MPHFPLPGILRYLEMKKKKKRTLTPERLEQLREQMAKARAAKVGKAVSAICSEPDLDKLRYQELAATTLVDIPAVIEEPKEVEITIDKLPPNPRLVMGRVSPDAPQFSVWVGNAQNFALQMKIKVHPHPTEAGLWEYSGPLPRQKGRWL